MFTITMTFQFLTSVFILIPLLQYCDAITITYWTQSSSVTGIQGQNITITFVANLSDHNSGTTWKLVTIVKGSSPVISIEPGKSKVVAAAFNSRSSDLDLNVTQNGDIVTIQFTLLNLVKATDEGAYTINPFGTSDFKGMVPPSATSLTINVPPSITSPSPSPGNVTLNETQTAQLVCTATGHPAPSYNWTRDGVIVGTGSPFTTPAVSFNDDNACYTCIAYNGVLDAKTASFCLNVQYKPRNATVLSDRLTVCQNEKVNLTCTSGPANPSLTSYEFYNNGVLLANSASRVYEATATVGLPTVNKFVCVPRNLLGPALENASVEVSAKVTPSIVTAPQATTVVERSALTIFCNASGAPVPNITWTKVGGSIVGNSETYTIGSVTRGDEGTYRCTASNSDECSNATAEANVVVNYPPENTTISTNQSENTFLKGNSVRLLCVSLSKPQLCNVTFYHGNTVLQNYYNKTCAGLEAASHVIQNIDGCNLEEYSCKVENQHGQQEAKVNLTIKVPATVAISPAADVILEEESPLQLNCTAAGCPTPNITWTKIGNSASLQRANGFFLSHRIGSLSKSDTGDYKCSVDNGLVGSPVERTIHVNVTYKPEGTTLTSSKNNACLNDQVTLQCATNANPPAYEYRFYLNDVLVQTSMSGEYQLNVPREGNNTYNCEPVNTVGAGQNATVTIATTAPPNITWSTPDQTLVEGDGLVLMCNVTGSEPLNVTWSKDGGSSYPEGYSYTISSIRRGDEATYRCTAHNGNECPVATATSSITVIYKPENTNMTASVATACKGDSLTLTCYTHAKPAPTLFRFYENNMIIRTQSANTYTFALSVSGSNVYKCVPENSAGNGTAANATVSVKATPVITYVTPSQTVVEGNSLTLVCNVTDQSGSLNVSWHKVGGGRVSTTNTYTMAPAARNDKGSYVCKAHNGNECDMQTKNISITVTYPALITSHSNTSVKSNENDQIVLICRVSGVPAPMVNWTRNGQMISNAHGETYTFNGLETLSGNYSCVVGNGVGAVQRKTFAVMIKGFCKNHECGNRGTCRSEGQSYRCLCTRGLTGDRCQTEDPIQTEFDCLLVIEKPLWKPGYGEANSKDFKELELMICTKMFLIFNEGPRARRGMRLVTCILISAREGSTYANTELTFNNTATRSEVLDVINGEIVNQTVFGNLTLRPSTLQVYPKTDPCSSEPCKFNTKCIVQDVGYRCECDAFRYGTHCEKGIGLIPGIIIILACIFIIIIIIILCVLYCKRRKSETYPAAAENGTQHEMKNYYLPDHEGAASNAQVTTTDEKPSVNGQPSEVYRQNGKEELIYAELSFKDDPETEKIEKELPEKSETLYADIVSFQQNTEEKPNDAPLAEEGIELKENPNTEPEKETKIDGVDENDGSKPTDNEDPEGTGANETSVKPENQYTPPPSKDKLV